MPPLPPVPNVVRVRTKHTLGDDFDVLDRFYVGYAGAAPTATQLDAFCVAINNAWTTDLEGLVPVDCRLTEVIATDLSSDTAAEGTAPEGENGSRTGGMLPASNAVLINFQISRRYRGGKPRIYFPFGTDTDVLTPQGWTGGFLTAMTTGWQNFIAAVVAAPWAGATPLEQVNVSYYQGSTASETGSGLYMRGHTKPTLRAVPLVDPIISFSVNPIFGSQRRRNRPK